MLARQLKVRTETQNVARSERFSNVDPYGPSVRVPLTDARNRPSSGRVR